MQAGDHADPSPGPGAGTGASAPHASPIFIESALLVLLRLAYFYLARRYLLAQLNPALRGLQKGDSLPALPTHLAVPPGGSSTGSRDRASSVLSVLSTRSTGSASGTAAAAVAGSSTGTSRPPGSRGGTPTNPSRPVPRTAESTDIDDTEDDPSSPSCPGTPSGNGATVRLLHGVATPPSPSIPDGGDAPIEMGLLGAKLRVAAAAPRREVLELSHARGEHRGRAGGKRAARGLGRVARTLFAVCFAESMNLVTLVVFQAAGILHARTRQVNFSVSLHILLAIVLLVVPLVQCLLFTYRSKESSTSTSASTQTSSLSFTSRLLISTLPFGLYVFLFTRIPPYITAVDDGSDDSYGGWLVPSLGRTVVLGVLIMASLSGIGAVRTAWDYLEQAAAGGRAISDADVLQGERALYRLRADVVGKRDELNRLAAAQPERSSGWISGVFASKADQKMAALKAELQGLQAMETDLARSLAGMKSKQQRQGFRKTWSGAVVNLLGYVFAIYCVARVAMCLVSLFVAPLATATLSQTEAKGNTNGDWISFLVALGIAHLPFHDIDIPTWSRGISLLLTGLLILSSLAMVLRWLTRVLRMTSRTVGAGFLLLALGQLYATYVVSLLVQLRSSLPPAPPEIDYGHGAAGNSSFDGDSAAATYAVAAAAAAATAAAHADESLLRSLPDFRVFGRLFDVVFLLAALGTAVYRYIAMRVARSDDGAIFGFAK